MWDARLLWPRVLPARLDRVLTRVLQLEQVKAARALCEAELGSASGQLEEARAAFLLAEKVLQQAHAASNKCQAHIQDLLLRLEDTEQRRSAAATKRTLLEEQKRTLTRTAEAQAGAAAAAAAEAAAAMVRAEAASVSVTAAPQQPPSPPPSPHDAPGDSAAMRAAAALVLERQLREQQQAEARAREAAELKAIEEEDRRKRMLYEQRVYGRVLVDEPSQPAAPPMPMPTLAASSIKAWERALSQQGPPRAAAVSPPPTTESPEAAARRRAAVAHAASGLAAYAEKLAALDAEKKAAEAQGDVARLELIVATRLRIEGQAHNALRTAGRELAGAAP